ncbi:hypothetical protein Dimus_032250 [Dionaea muscipula]
MVVNVPANKPLNGGVEVSDLEYELVDCLIEQELGKPEKPSYPSCGGVVAQPLSQGKPYLQAVQGGLPQELEQSKLNSASVLAWAKKATKPPQGTLVRAGPQATSGGLASSLSKGSVVGSKGSQQWKEVSEKGCKKLALGMNNRMAQTQ